MPEGSRSPRAAVVVMGVAGCGKSVVGERLAERLGARFIEGDRLHPPENIARMARGQPLSDADREGWLDAIGAALAAAKSKSRAAVAACSALKRRYRDRLRGWRPDLRFVYLDIDRATAAARVAARQGHFMPASLVDSQFADLQPPGSDEQAIALDARQPVETLVAEAAAGLAAPLASIIRR